MTIKAILFDAYGTLLDIHSAVAQYNDRLGSSAAAISALWRQKQLEYSWTLTLVQQYRPFDELTAAALDFSLEQYKVQDPALRRDLLSAYRRLAPFPDVAPALQALSKRSLRLGILSNGTPEMLRDAFQPHPFASLLHPIISVDGLKIYKPDPRVYAMATEMLNLDRSEIGFVSSNGWDAMGAARFGFRVFWLRRQPGPTEYDLPTLAIPIASLTELAEQL